MINKIEEKLKLCIRKVWNVVQHLKRGFEAMLQSIQPKKMDWRHLQTNSLFLINQFEKFQFNPLINAHINVWIKMQVLHKRNKRKAFMRWDNDWLMKMLVVVKIKKKVKKFCTTLTCDIKIYPFIPPLPSLNYLNQILCDLMPSF